MLTYKRNHDDLPSLKLAKKAPENRQRAPTGNESSSNHQFVGELLVSGRVVTKAVSYLKHFTFDSYPLIHSLVHSHKTKM